MIAYQLKFPGRLLGVNITVNLKRKVPGTWNELSRKQLKKISTILSAGIEDEYELKVKLLKVIFKIKLWHLMALSERLVDLLPAVGFLIDDIELTENKFYRLKPTRWSLKKLYGPNGDFLLTSVKEWTDADTQFMAYSQSRKAEYLDNLIAILWRPADKNKDKRAEDYDGDMRIAYNPHTVTKRTVLIKTLHPGTKAAILFWYMSCRQRWENAYTRVFAGSKENVESFGWVETVLKVSGSEFGTLVETENTRMWKVLLHMEAQLKDQEYFDSKNPS